MFLKFRKKHKSSLDLQNYFTEKIFKFLKNINLLLIYILIFFRLHKVPIISKKDLEKKTVPRGHTDVLYKDNQVLVAWKDNKGVCMASNKFCADTTNNCRRFCRTERKYLTVPIPIMVQRYNTGMGGVDLMDNMVAVYRIPFRIKKWYFPIYTWSLSVSAVNAWRLRMRQTGHKEPYLNFLRELCIGMLTEHGTKPVRRRSIVSNDGETRLTTWAATGL
jgi:hypothetical protein